jgi:rhodanese-related sulfurtransferase
MPEAPRITADELKRRMDAGEDFTVIDVRNPQAWGQSDTMIPEAIRVPLDDFERHLSQIPKDRPIVAYCTWPDEGSSASLAQQLIANGYQAWALKGGFDAWREAGFPVESKRKVAWGKKSKDPLCRRNRGKSGAPVFR